MKKIRPQKILIFDVIDEESVNKFNKYVKKKPTFVQFYSPTCGYCHALEPHWESLTATLKKRYDGDVMVVRVRSDMMGKINADKQIAGFPTIFVLEKGKKINEFNDKREARVLLNFMKKNFKLKRKRSKTHIKKRRSRRFRRYRKWGGRTFKKRRR